MVLLSFALIHSAGRICVCIFVASLCKLFGMHHRPLATEPWQSGAFTLLQTTSEMKANTPGLLASSLPLDREEIFLRL